MILRIVYIPILRKPNIRMTCVCLSLKCTSSGAPVAVPTLSHTVGPSPPSLPSNPGDANLFATDQIHHQDRCWNHFYSGLISIKYQFIRDVVFGCIFNNSLQEFFLHLSQSCPCAACVLFCLAHPILPIKDCAQSLADSTTTPFSLREVLLQQLRIPDAAAMKMNLLVVPSASRSFVECVEI